MKKIKMLRNWFPFIEVDMNSGKKTPKFMYYKSKEYVLTEHRAKELLNKKILRFDPFRILKIAELAEDLGIHIGRSKHIYLKNGLSKVTN